MRTGQALQVLAPFRNVILNLYRARGGQNNADAIRLYAAAVSRAADLSDVQPGRLGQRPLPDAYALTTSAITW